MEIIVWPMKRADAKNRERKAVFMKYAWIAAALAALDQGIKQNIEEQEDQSLPRDLPCAKGWIRLHKNHNAGFPFGFLKSKPQMVQTIPLMMTSALAGALAALYDRRDGAAGILERFGLAVALGGAISNTWDRMVRGYVVDYFSVQWKGLKRVVFNLGDIFIFLGAVIVLIGRGLAGLKESRGDLG